MDAFSWSGRIQEREHNPGFPMDQECNLMGPTSCIVSMKKDDENIYRRVEKLCFVDKFQ